MKYHLHKYPILIAGHVLFWLSYLTAEHISHLLYGENHWQGSVFSSVFIMVASALLAMLFIKLEKKSVSVRYTLVLFLGLLTLVFWNNLTSILHGHTSLTALIQAPILESLTGSAYRVLLIIAWAGLLASGYNYLQKKAHAKEIEQAQHTAKEAQLQLLMTQINPHFLFNVLNSLDVAILDKDTKTAHQMLIKLSQFLRITLEHKFDKKIPLHQELSLLSYFVEIEQQRSKQHIEFNYQIQSDAEQAYLPPLILQPLMENAIKFSRQILTDCEIILVATISNKLLHINISNPYIETAYSNTNGTNTGLNNVKNRIELLYGSSGQFCIQIGNNRFSVNLIIPLEVAA
ncbi:hypothetical protein PSECIP111951_00095 [Pseudoalteromonas holothuriae]|uniref:Signal transduction histidine kinase internal region domain-containing protein n=1 Tax=Pseudoalteromonas holothuriae TaxID=2963714 RepID=A0ABN8UFS7_9GAMM|nr:hypothetical protein PSECIP111951_00095 [Pseudoalteromonas sp. CIP111951]